MLTLLPSTSGAATADGGRRQAPTRRTPIRDDWADGDDYGSYDNFTPTASRPPSEEEIAAVTALGFDRLAAINALRNTDNNIEAAVNMLLR